MATCQLSGGAGVWPASRSTTTVSRAGRLEGLLAGVPARLALLPPALLLCRRPSRQLRAAGPPVHPPCPALPSPCPPQASCAAICRVSRKARCCPAPAGCASTTLATCLSRTWAARWVGLGACAKGTGSCQVRLQAARDGRLQVGGGSQHRRASAVLISAAQLTLQLGAGARFQQPLLLVHPRLLCRLSSMAAHTAAARQAGRWACVSTAPCRSTG